MFLHNNIEDFQAILDAISATTGATRAIVEKDYYITLFLKKLTEQAPDLIFKGGTSLSKCYKIINRFSEDLDITLPKESTQSRKKQLKYQIVNITELLGLKHLNADSIESGKSYCRHEIEYPKLYEDNYIKSNINVETVFRPISVPVEKFFVNSIIAEYLIKTKNEDIINRYDLSCYPIFAQSLKMTFIEKLFGLCNYYLENRIESNSRHLYDLHKIYPYIEFDDEYESMFLEISAYEKGRHINTTGFMHEREDFGRILKELVEKEKFKKDYNSITIGLVYDDIVSYDETIGTLEETLSHLDCDFQL